MRWLVSSRPLALLCTSSPAAADPVTPPAGFKALFNGTDLTGWRGGATNDPRQEQALPPAERAALNDVWKGKEHWKAEGGELVNDGKGDYATTVEDYGDFELLVEYKTVPKADSGIYLRGTPQVQIWDSVNPEKFSLGSDKGSGGLWNNPAGSPGKDPLVKAASPSVSGTSFASSWSARA